MITKMWVKISKSYVNFLWPLTLIFYNKYFNKIHLWYILRKILPLIKTYIHKYIINLNTKMNITLNTINVVFIEIYK